MFRSGGYADHLLVPHPRYLFDIGNIPPERAAPLACSGITTYGALKKVGPLLQEEPVVIIGAGGLGLMCLALHKAMGGKGAIVVDIDPVKREAAKKAGAMMTIDSNAPDASKQIIEATNGGAGAVIDLVGASRTAQLGLDSLLQRRQADHRRPVWRRHHRADAVVSVARHHASRDRMSAASPKWPSFSISCAAKASPDLPVGKRPLAAVNDALEELKSGKVVGRLVLMPAE